MDDTCQNIVVDDHIPKWRLWVCWCLLCLYFTSFFFDVLPLVARVSVPGSEAFDLSMSGGTSLWSHKERRFSWTLFTGWLANPFFIVGLSLFAFGRYQIAAAFGLTATAMALVWGAGFTLVAKYGHASEYLRPYSSDWSWIEHTHRFMPAGHVDGYAMWLGAFSLLSILGVLGAKGKYPSWFIASGQFPSEALNHEKRYYSSLTSRTLCAS
jgi:hypothetical protein